MHTADLCTTLQSWQSAYLQPWQMKKHSVSQHIRFVVEMGETGRWAQECMARNEKNPLANTLNMVTSPCLLLQWNVKHKDGIYKATWRAGQKLSHTTSCRSTFPSLSTFTKFGFAYTAYPTSLTLYDTGGCRHMFFPLPTTFISLWHKMELWGQTRHMLKQLPQPSLLKKKKKPWQRNQII